MNSELDFVPENMRGGYAPRPLPKSRWRAWLGLGMGISAFVGVVCFFFPNLATSALGAVLVLGLLAVGGLLYFAPSVVAVRREHDSALAIVVLNVFLGWTFVGWVLALVWACAGKWSKEGGLQGVPRNRTAARLQG